ncbi:hypothetical protein NO2_0305 [Candidatus Termititenax persephonae]|uniref:Uncharacterized protein n=1 Tax=Candidatus Termititenax persephonae TaxID=2218525 RepID=A0A388TFX1_9BACT|nr:hypothetical protein NO2_0305 [Candidatus Termititenax persephonae]
MSGFSLKISEALPQYQRALRRADAGNGDKAYNGSIDTNEELLNAAQEVSKEAAQKFNGSSVSEAESYLRRVALGQNNAVQATQAVQSDSKPVALLKKPEVVWGPGKYTVNGNTLTIDGSGTRGEASGVFLGKINPSGYTKLVVTVTSIEGKDKLIWGGKAVGFGLNEGPYDPQNTYNHNPVMGAFPEPEGFTVNDSYIEQSLDAGDELVYDISGMKDIWVGIKGFVNNGFKMTVQVELKN